MRDSFDKILLVAEVKTCSPFGYKADKSWEEQFELANRIGDIISIHTHEAWGGSFDDISRARRLTKKPILAKGIHETDEEIIKAIRLGATYALVVGRVPRLNPNFVREHCWIEPLSIDQIQDVPEDLRLVWNSRDLQTGGLKKHTIMDVKRLWSGWLCMASNLKTPEDVINTPVAIDAVLIGTYLANFKHNRGF